MGLYTSEEIIMNTSGKRWTVGPGWFSRLTRLIVHESRIMTHVMSFNNENRSKQHTRFQVLVKWRKNSKLISIVMAISIILNEFTDQKLLENLQFSWDQVSIMP